MKSILIAAPNSNTGKTTMCMALIAAMQNKKLITSGFKTGPDQLDTLLLADYADKVGNLDPYLMGKDGIFYSLGIAENDYAVIEGVMGCFDGIYNTYKNSSFDLACKLDINIILIYSPSGEMFTMIPKLKGMIDFSKNRIKGIILNKISKKSFSIYKQMITDNLDIEVLGFLPKNKDLKTSTNYLGLSASGNSKIDFNHTAINEIQRNINLNKLLELFKNVKTKKHQYNFLDKITVAIAKDDCFSLYYNENIALLKEFCNIKYFSPLKSNSLPKCELIYFENCLIKDYMSELSKNKNLLSEIKKFAESNGFILAQSESLNYLFQTYNNLPMCNIFKGKAVSTTKLVNFGYNKIKLNKNTILGKKDLELNACEYHKSMVETNLQPVLKISKPDTSIEWNCGYEYKNVLAFYPHINFLQNIDCLYNMLKTIRSKNELY